MLSVQPLLLLLLVVSVLAAAAAARVENGRNNAQKISEDVAGDREALLAPYGCLSSPPAATDPAAMQLCAEQMVEASCRVNRRKDPHCRDRSDWKQQALVAMKVAGEKRAQSGRQPAAFPSIATATRGLRDPVESGPQQVHLSASPVTFAEMKVMWVSRKSERDGKVYWRPLHSAGAFSQAAAAWSTYDAGVFGWSGSIHTAVMTGLNASSRYEYYVETAGDKSQTFSFSTNPKAGDGSVKRTYAVVADMGTAIPVGFEVTDFIDRENGPDKDVFSLTVHAGDVCYAGTGSTDEFEEVWDAWGDQTQKLAAFMPYQFAVGNHEHYYNYSSFRHRYDMSGDSVGGRHNFWYNLPYGNVMFVFMSTEHPYEPGTVQHDFLEKTLAAIDRKQFPWIVYLGHRPMYNTDTGEWGSHRPGSHLEKMIEPLLLKYKVDLCIWGHQHMYERVFPVRTNSQNEGVVDTAAISADGHIYTRPTSPAHMVQATAGVFTDRSYIDPQPKWSAVRGPQWGYGRMTVHNATHLQYEFRDWFEEKTIDYFWIVK